MKVRRSSAVKIVGVSGAIGLLAAFTVPSTNGGPSYGVAAARDILAMLGDRSPGERTHGKLRNTKVPRLPYEFAKSPVHVPVPDNSPGEMEASPRLIASLVEPETPFSVAPTPTPAPPDAPETPLPPVFTGSSGGTPIFVEGGSSGGGSSGGGSSGGGSSSGGTTSSGGDTGSSGGSSTSSGGSSTSSGGDSSTSSGGSSTSSGGSSTSSGGSSTSSGGSSTSSGGSSGGEPPPIVPEPGTWLMMMAGFGLVGAMLRRRRKSAESARQIPVARASGTDV